MHCGGPGGKDVPRFVEVTDAGLRAVYRDVLVFERFDSALKVGLSLVGVTGGQTRPSAEKQKVRQSDR
jgi:hypothetical protein